MKEKGLRLLAVRVDNTTIKFIKPNEDAAYVSTTPTTAVDKAIYAVRPYTLALISPDDIPKGKNPNIRHISYINKDTKKLCFKEGLVAELTPVNVIFNPPATIVFWEDGEKTVVKCGEGETYDKEKGLAMAFCKRVWGNKGRFNTMFEKWCFGDEKTK